MKTLKGINSIASIVENARRRSLAKEEKENKKRDSFCKGNDSRRGSFAKNGSRRESLILGFESEEEKGEEKEKPQVRGRSIFPAALTILLVVTYQKQSKAHQTFFNEGNISCCLTFGSLETCGGGPTIIAPPLGGYNTLIYMPRRVKGS